MAVNGIGDFNNGLAAPAVDAEAVTPSDGTNLAGVATSACGSTRSLYVGGAGAVAVIMKGGGTVTFSAVPVGTFLPLRVTRVLSTGTTATLLVALY